MKRLAKKLKNCRGMTLVEMLAAAGVLALLALMLYTGLALADRSYRSVTSEAESQLLLSTLTDVLSTELRYARDIVEQADGTLRYTSINYGLNTVLSLNEAGQVVANGKLVLTTGAYGNGEYWIEDWSIQLVEDVFQVEIQLGGRYGVSKGVSFSVHCLNRAGI